MKSTNETNARDEMDRIWNYDTVRGEKPTFYELNLERRVKVLEAKVAELDRVIVEVLHETNR